MKRTLSLFVTILLLIGALPLTAFGAGEPTDPEPLSAQSLTIRNKSNEVAWFTVTITAPEGQPVTSAITIDAGGTKVFALPEGATYTVEISRPAYWDVSNESAVLNAYDTDGTTKVVEGYSVTDTWTQTLGYLEQKNKYCIVLSSAQDKPLRAVAEKDEEGNISYLGTGVTLAPCYGYGTNKDQFLVNMGWTSEYTDLYFIVETCHLYKLGNTSSGSTCKPKYVCYTANPNTSLSNGPSKQFTEGATENYSTVFYDTAALGKEATAAIWKADFDGYVTSRPWWDAATYTKYLPADAISSSTGRFATKYASAYQLVKYFESCSVACDSNRIELVYDANVNAEAAAQVSVQILNQERFDQLNALNNSLVESIVTKGADGLRLSDKLKDLTAENIASVLQDETLQLMGSIFATDTMPLPETITLTPVDDGFVQSTEPVKSVSRSTSFLHVKLMDFLTNSNVTAGEISGIITLIKSFSDNDNFIDELEVLLEDLELPISIGGTYTFENLAPGEYVISAETADGWSLPQGAHILIKTDGTVTAVPEDTSYKKQYTAYIQLDELVQTLTDGEILMFDGEALIIALKGALGDGFMTTPQPLLQAEGLWATHVTNRIQFKVVDQDKSNTPLAGATFMLINREQLIDLTDAVMALGKDAIEAVAEGIGYTELSDLKSVLSKATGGEIDMEAIKGLLLTAVENSDKLSGINVPTILEATSDQNGLVTFTEDSAMSVGKIFQLASGIYDTYGDLQHLMDEIEADYVYYESEWSRLWEVIQAMFENPTQGTAASRLTEEQTALPMLMTSGNTADSANQVALLTAAVYATQANLAATEPETNSELRNLLAQIGDAEQVNALFDFIETIQGLDIPQKEPAVVPNPSVKISGGSVLQMGKTSSTKYTVTVTDIDTYELGFSWKTAVPDGITQSWESNKLVLTCDAGTDFGGAVSAAYKFEVTAGDKSAAGTLTIKQADLTVGKASNTLRPGIRGTATYNLSAAGITNPDYSASWGDEEHSGLSFHIDGTVLTVEGSKATREGTYQLQVTVTGDGKSDTKAAKIEIKEPDKEETEQLIESLMTFGNNSLGYAALNLVGLNDGTFTTGHYILIQGSAPEGYRRDKMVYTVTSKWDGEQYSTVAEQGVALPMAREQYEDTNDLVTAIKERALLETAQRIDSIVDDMRESWNRTRSRFGLSQNFDAVLELLAPKDRTVRYFGSQLYQKTSAYGSAEEAIEAIRSKLEGKDNWTLTDVVEAAESLSRESLPYYTDEMNEEWTVSNRETLEKREEERRSEGESSENKEESSEDGPAEELQQAAEELQAEEPKQAEGPQLEEPQSEEADENTDAENKPTSGRSTFVNPVEAIAKPMWQMTEKAISGTLQLIEAGTKVVGSILSRTLGWYRR